MAVFIKNFYLPTKGMENNYFAHFHLTCFDSPYPFQLFSRGKDLFHVDFDDVTIFSGGNGTGKSTLLNIIAEKLSLKRECVFNKTYFFEPFTDLCDFESSVPNLFKYQEIMKMSRIITSDDVFNHILKTRDRNETLSSKREIVFKIKRKLNTYGAYEDAPKGFDADNPDSIREYIEYSKLAKKGTTMSSYVRKNLGMEERTYSNGENGFRYFCDCIKPGGLYLLDEPENSLSAEMQLQLVEYVQTMARFYDCQFILSSHSPFILSMPYAKIYNFDEEPIETCKWTELPNVRIFYDFFRDHMEEF